MNKIQRVLADWNRLSPMDRNIKAAANVIGIRSTRKFEEAVIMQMQNGNTITSTMIVALYCKKCKQRSADDPVSCVFNAVEKYDEFKAEFDEAMETYFPQFEAPQAKAAKIDKPEAIRLDMTQVENLELRQQVAALQAENMRLVCENHRLRGAK